MNTLYKTSLTTKKLNLYNFELLLLGLQFKIKFKIWFYNSCQLPLGLLFDSLMTIIVTVNHQYMHYVMQSTEL